MAEAASKTIQLKIDRLTYGPDAIARDEDDRAIFVQGAEGVRTLVVQSTQR